MATKKCPKCGEENPAEAVMCWACYTPLAGGAAAVAGGGLVTPRGGAAAVTPAATAAHQDEKKSIDPKIFLVVGLLVAAGIIGGFTTGLFGGGSGGGDDIVAATTTTDGPAGFSTTRNQTNINIQAPPAPSPGSRGPSSPGGSGNPGAPTLPAVAAPFDVVVGPDPRWSNSAMAIVPNTPNISPSQARSLAKFAKQSYEAGGKWKSMQVIVFSDKNSARAFQKYQASRKGAALTINEYRDLAAQGMWSNVPAFYETQGKAEVAYQPSANPNNWWTRKAS